MLQEKDSKGNAENEASMAYYTPENCKTKLAPAQFHCNFPIFRCLERFCRRIQMPSRLFFMYHIILY